MSRNNSPIIETYKGNEAKARRLFLKDRSKKAKKGFLPVSENFTQGVWGTGSFLVALLLCLVVVGIFIFIYMVLVKPDGTLTVTYEKKKREAAPAMPKPIQDEKVCPECAETIKEAAKICRYCKFQFEEKSLS